MKKIQFRRHSIKEGPGNTDLSEAGIRLAQEVGREYLQEKHFTHIFVSSLKRTHDTATEFMRGAGELPALSFQLFQPGVEVGGTEEALELWSGACNQAEHAGQDMVQAALEKEALIAQDIARKSAVSFKHWLALLPDGMDALVVSHSPFMELMAYGLFDTILPQLGYCEGFEIIEDKSRLTLHPLEKYAQ